ncbi:MAG: A/G-specific adenine glycosylase [Candidatus Omnitrophica bacterium]|nr:A/G-specific adenine glycosylase [Candidatus Omnitrophota bacterium]
MHKLLPSPTKLRQSLLRWYSRHKRDLPWRRTRDPYKIWVSEIMLQQTQVATVIPFYKRWLKVFPSLSSLARASLSEALKSWAGLGYYRRVRMFHQAATYILKELHGNIPETAEGLKKLPGIGRYTAGAIASIAFGEKTPVLDGNVIRILTRIFSVAQDVDRPATLEKLWSIAASLLPRKNPGDLNQALMELGATVCFPFTPQCSRCPVKKSCAAHHKGKELFYPVRSKKDRYEKITTSALVLRNSKNEVWLEKQPSEGRWGGLWMFPFWAHKKEMMEELRSSGSRPALFLTVPHAFTKYRITLEVFGLLCGKRSPLNRPCGRWFSIEDLAQAAFPSPHRKIAQALINRNGSLNPLFPKRGLAEKNPGARLT